MVWRLLNRRQTSFSAATDHANSKFANIFILTLNLQIKSFYTPKFTKTPRYTTHGHES